MDRSIEQDFGAEILVLEIIFWIAKEGIFSRSL
jgi:hypothetical protein